MSNSRRLSGTDLRYVLTMHMFDHGSSTIKELVDALNTAGFEVAGRASKSVSDALRWEIEHERVRRFGRGRYGPGWMPRATEHRIHRRVLALRHQKSDLSLRGGHNDTSQLPGAPGAHVTYPPRGLAKVKVSTTDRPPKGPCTA